jgi:hypothetical protein
MEITYQQFELEVFNLALPILDDIYTLLSYRFLNSKNQIIDRLNRNLFKIQDFKPHQSNKDSIKQQLFDRHLFAKFPNFIYYTDATTNANHAMSRTSLSDKQIFDALDGIYELLAEQLSTGTFKTIIPVLEKCFSLDTKPQQTGEVLKLCIAIDPLDDNRNNQLRTIQWVLSHFLGSVISTYVPDSVLPLRAKELVTNTIIDLTNTCYLSEDELDELVDRMEISETQLKQISVATGYDLK